MSDPQQAKQSLESFVSQIDTKLEHYWDSELALSFGFNQKQKTLIEEVLTHAKEHNLRSAKRLRGSFAYYGYLLGSQPPDDRIWNVAMAVELVHTALLIHDDFMDQDEVRRGKPTTHTYFFRGDRHYGDSMAISIGDSVLCIGFELLLKSGFEGKTLQRAMSKMLRGIAQTAYGQTYDITLEHLRTQWTEDDIIAVHKAKTSIYTFENPLLIGALLGDVPEEAFPILHDYAMDGGIAFQMQDDVLGIFGKPEKTGKSADSDLLQGKCTLLVMKALENGTSGEVQAIEKVWGKKSANSEDIHKAKQAVIDSGSLAYSIRVSKEYAVKAAHRITDLKKLALNNKAIDYLEGIAQYLTTREL